MKEFYTPGKTLTLVSLQLSALSIIDNQEKVVTLPNNGVIEKTLFHEVFPPKEYLAVNTLISVNHVRIANTTVRLDDIPPTFIAVDEKAPEYFTVNSQGQIVVTENNGDKPECFIRTYPVHQKNEIMKSHIWSDDSGQQYFDLHYLHILVEQARYWGYDTELSIGQDFFNIMTNFIAHQINEKKSQQGQLNILRPPVKTMSFVDIRNSFDHHKNKLVNLLISQFALPPCVDIATFLQHFNDELLDSFPMKRTLLHDDISIYSEVVVLQNNGGGKKGAVRTEIRLGIFTTLYNRLQSRIIKTRNVGTLEEKVMQAMAAVFEDLGVSSHESKFYLHLNKNRHFIVNRVVGKSYDIFSRVVLPINDEYNWRDKLNSFIKFSSYNHNNRPINLHCIKLSLNAPISTIPPVALLRLRAEIECDTGSKLLCIEEGERTLYVFTTSHCVKAHLKDPGNILQTSVGKTHYLKTLFGNKININHTVIDEFTVFNLYSDVDIESVYQTILNRGTIEDFVKPELVVC